MRNVVYVTGAWGRNPVEADWKAGRSFRIVGVGMIVNISMRKLLKALGYYGFTVLDNHGREVFTVNV